MKDGLYTRHEVACIIADLFGGTCACDYRQKIPEYYEAIEMAVDALEEADKYRWHDLRENPDDLPEAIGGSYVSEYVFVMIGTPGWNNCEWAYYKHNHKEWSTYEQNIIAWRYIEPFEEEEKCVSD